MDKLFIILLLSFHNFAYAQEEIQLSLRWNPKLSRYDVFAKPNFTKEQVFIGPTLITVVVPAESPDDIFKITSTDIGIGIGLSQDKVLSAHMVDFHTLSSMGGAKVDFVQNQELLLFGFTFMDNQCREGVRLFENEIDTDLMPAELQSYDFRNSIINPFTLQEFYISNYNNIGTICFECKEKLIVPYLIKKTLNLKTNEL
jgi:hypothetical protein